MSESETKPAADSLPRQSVSVRRRVLSGIESIQRGNYRDYQGRRGLKKLANEVKARGRKLLTKATSH